MIAVIADDLTGAAEIAGIALRHGFRVVIETKVHPDVDTDILVIATDTRSKTAEEAKSLTRKVTEDLLKLKPQFIFKKADSLLRGHVGEELDSQMTASGKKRTLLIPANPSLKRTIKDGIYYADNVPLNESQLAEACRNKIPTSGVVDLIGEKFRDATRVISKDEKFPETGLLIGNTITEADLDSWAQQLEDDTIPAGSGGFFNAILKSSSKNGKRKLPEDLHVGKRIMYVCGSAFPLSRTYVAQAHRNGRFVSYMPENIFCGDIVKGDIFESWIEEIKEGLLQHTRVIIAVDQLQCDDTPELPVYIRTVMASVIEKIMQQVKLDELVIEGGATASSIIEKLEYERFFPTQELAQGVIRMRVQQNKGLFITMKPGSYQWPSSIWNQPIMLIK